MTAGDPRADGERPHPGVWEGADAIERATLVLGPGLFAALIVGGFFAGVAEWHRMTFGDYVQAAAGGAGLVAIGHGIHRSVRLRRDR
jgi:hypothetical protein